MLDLGTAATFNAVITAEDLSAGQAITSYAVDYFGEPNPKVVSAQSRTLSGEGRRGRSLEGIPAVQQRGALHPGRRGARISQLHPVRLCRLPTF